MEEEDGAQPSLSPKKQKASAPGFRLRVALRSAPPAQQSTDEDEVEGEKRTEKKDVHTKGKKKRKRNVGFEDEKTAVARLSPSEERGSDSADDVSTSFLVKREQNIKANKAMVTKKHKTANCTVQYCLEAGGLMSPTWFI